MPIWRPHDLKFVPGHERFSVASKLSLRPLQPPRQVKIGWKLLRARPSYSSVHESRRRRPAGGGRAILAAPAPLARWFSCFSLHCRPRRRIRAWIPFLLANRDEIESEPDVEARGLQLYRLPFSVHVRSLDKHPWGLRITFPVSLSSLHITGISDLDSFVDKLRIAAIIPGLEVEIPVGSRTLVRPFGEVGIGKSNDSSEVFYGAGLRAHTVADLKKLHLTYGGLISGRKKPALPGTAARYASFEGGADVQVPLGFSVRGRRALGGIYAIGRAFDGLELEREHQPTIVLRGQFEAGLSASTAPELRIWKIPLRWLAAGYRFGRVSGVRIYLAFPF